MTLEQIEDLLPNGFHDSKLQGFNVDLRDKRVIFNLEVDLTSPDRELSADEPCSKHVRVTVTGVEYFRLDPPDIAIGKYDFCESDVSSGTIDDHPELMGPGERDKLPKRCFAHWFFLSSWNAFLVVAGTDASFEDLAKP